jgi:ankyrin repeat protein
MPSLLLELIRSSEEIQTVEAALKAASAKGHEKVVRWLLEISKGVSQATQVKREWKTLTYAVKNDHVKKVEFLLDRTHDIILKTRDEMRRTVLHLATFANHPDIVELLLQHGVDRDVQDKHGCTALHYAS